MILLLFFSAIIQIALSSCPAGFELVGNGQCRELVPYVSQICLDEDGAGNIAIERCKEIQAVPVIIHNDEEQNYWKSHNDTRIILGLVCNATSTKWKWIDGSAVNYSPSEGADSALTKDCRTMTGVWYMYTYSGSYGQWWYRTGLGLTFDIYCITQLQQPVLPNTCLDFEDDNEDETCYQISATAENWQDAQMACKEVGANLASIHNTNENSFVRRLAVPAGAVHGLFLGATITGKGDSYGWIDGSAWDYENFYSGFHGIGDCIAMDTSTSSGLWMNVDCTAKLPVACVRERKTIEQKNVTCNVQTFAENTIITSPGFPTDASMPCDYFLTVDAGKKVEMEIVLLEANSCCDFLILSDGYFGGFEIAHLTGEIKNVTYTTTDSNIMKVSWQPNGGVNVRGMAITFRGV